jgi:hypothetical protein
MPSYIQKTYRIIDSQTGAQVGGLYASRVRALRRADRLDMAYGAYRYRVEAVPA